MPVKNKKSTTITPLSPSSSKRANVSQVKTELEEDDLCSVNSSNEEHDSSCFNLTSSSTGVKDVPNPYRAGYRVDQDDLVVKPDEGEEVERDHNSGSRGSSSTYGLDQPFPIEEPDRTRIIQSLECPGGRTGLEVETKPVLLAQGVDVPLSNPYLSPPPSQFPSTDDDFGDAQHTTHLDLVDQKEMIQDTSREQPIASSSRSTSTTSRKRKTTSRPSVNPYLTPLSSHSGTSESTPRTRTNSAKPSKGKKQRPNPPTPSSSTSSMSTSGPSEYATLKPHGLAEYTVPINDSPQRREAGVPRGELSEDETMTKMFVGNVYRELDRGSLRMKDEIIAEGEQSIEEVCFRLFLFCGFYEYPTWCALKNGLGHIPTYSTFQAEFPLYEKILHAKSFGRKETLYTSGFQIVPPTRYFGLNKLPHYAATLRFVKSLMETRLPERLASCRYAVDASKTLQTIPTLGAFLSLNILCYLNDTTHFKFFYRNFASCGPGSRGFLERIFGKSAINSVAAEEAGLVWLYENQWRYWARLGFDPPYASGIPGIRPGMRCLDMENALCWCHRYLADSTKHSWSSFADLPQPSYDPAKTELADFPAWCVNKGDEGSSSSAMLKGDYDEAKEKLPGVKNEEGDLEEVYEVEKVVCRLGSRIGGRKDGLFRVRWKGYPPEDDTWERESTLKDGAQEALQDWLDWEECVWGTIDRIKEEMPWTKPDIRGMSGVKVERQDA